MTRNDRAFERLLAENRRIREENGRLRRQVDRLESDARFKNWSWPLACVVGSTVAIVLVHFG